MSPLPPLVQMRRIAVLRANAMGDYLHSEPALAALRAAAPEARITLLGGDFAGQLCGRPGPIDEVVQVPYLDGVRQPPAGEQVDQQAVAAFYERMLSRRFDLAVQLHGGGRNSNPVVLAIGARHTAGLRAFDAPPLDCSLSYQYWQHEIFRYLEVAAALGAPPVRVQPQFTALQSDIDASHAVLAPSSRPLVVIHAGATDPRRCWPAQGFGQVADVLTSRGADVVVIGSADEVAPVLQHGRSAIGAAATTFPQLVGLLRRAVLLVGNDSGPRHLADALGTPTVSVYWCGNMVNAAPVGRAHNRVHVAWTTDCPVCGKSLVGEPFPQACCDTVSWVSSVPVATVVASAVELFEISMRDASVREADEE